MTYQQLVLFLCLEPFSLDCRTISHLLWLCISLQSDQRQKLKPLFSQSVKLKAIVACWYVYMVKGVSGQEKKPGQISQDR